MECAEGPGDAEQRASLQKGSVENGQSADDATSKLENNTDYKYVASALAVLRDQLEQAKRDIYRLREVHNSALEDPFGFIHSIRTKTAARMPQLQQVIPVPDINIEAHIEFAAPSTI
ncbi:hypothetical protein EV182_006626, partial [Spiromyces aspiralis]